MPWNAGDLSILLSSFAYCNVKLKKKKKKTLHDNRTSHCSIKYDLCRGVPFSGFNLLCFVHQHDNRHLGPDQAIIQKEVSIPRRYYRSTNAFPYPPNLHRTHGLAMYIRIEEYGAWPSARHADSVLSFMSNCLRLSIRPFMRPKSVEESTPMAISH